MKLDLVQVTKKYWLTILMTGFILFLTGSLWTFSPTDSSWFYHATKLQSYKNMFGFFGSNCAAWFIYLFGRAAFLSVFVVFYYVGVHFFMCVIKKIQFTTEWDRALGVFIGFLSATVFCQVYAISSYDFSYPGGIIGSYITTHLFTIFDSITQKIIIWMMLLFSTILITRCSYIPMFLYLGTFLQYCCNPQKMPARIVFALYSYVVIFTKLIIFLTKKAFDIFTGSALKKLDSSIVEFEQEGNVDQSIEQVVQDLFWHDYIDIKTEQKTIPASKSFNNDEFLQNDTLYEEQFLQEDTSGTDLRKSVFHAMIEKKSKKPNNTLDTEHDEIVHQFEKIEYDLPTIPVKKIEQKIVQEKQDIVTMQARLLEQKLKQFDIDGDVIAMHAGPVVTLFEYQPDIKVKVSRILSLEDDLAMALKALSIRIIAPIPGRSVVGFEIANLHRQDVVMAKILQSQEFKKHPGALPIIFGQDTLGNDVIADLAKMPHLLIAGSTGSGKSVALNAILVSLLCSLKPTELKLVIIDPKRLEFAAYDGIAHLLFPIVTDTKKAIPILKWVVQTMEQRYETMAKFSVKNLFDYQMVARQNKEMEPMPFMIVIIDELADLMMTAGKAVEDSIARIAQMARAAGIHMIIATQRPSVDVITGMIKVNFPNRVAFKVTSKIDSRTILDVGGAEKLLGRGDMLFLDATKSHVVRAHGAYISDQEIHDVVSQIKTAIKSAIPQYF